MKMKIVMCSMPTTTTTSLLSSAAMCDAYRPPRAEGVEIAQTKSSHEFFPTSHHSLH